MNWKVTETKTVAKELLRLPKRVKFIYTQLVDDMEKEGPKPYGWDSMLMRGSDTYRIKLVREYRVIVEVMSPNIIVVKVAHRKEAYK